MDQRAYYKLYMSQSEESDENMGARNDRLR